MTEMTDTQVLEARIDAEMIKRDWLWPSPMLPLKRRREGGYDTAVVIGTNPRGEVVVIESTTMFGPVNGDVPKKVAYPSAEAVVQAGWMVD